MPVRRKLFHPLLFIPVYNARHLLLELLPRLRETGIDVAVLNDGSTDGLIETDILPPFIYLAHSINRGKGAALKTGLEWGKANGYSHLISLDADGQHPVSFLSAFLHECKHNPESLIVARRHWSTASMPVHRILSNSITSLILSLRTGRRIYDSQVGYRAYPLGNRRLWQSTEDGFQFESDIFFNARKLNLSLVWISIPVIYSSEISHMNYIKDTLLFIRTFFRSFYC